MNGVFRRLKSYYEETGGIMSAKQLTREFPHNQEDIKSGIILFDFHLDHLHRSELRN